MEAATGASPAAAIWNRLPPVVQTPSARCIARALADRQEMLTQPRDPDVFTHFEEHDVTKVHGLVLGPAGTPYEGGAFHVAMRLPGNYPSEPPRVALLTTDAGRVSFHPQLLADGRVTLKLLASGQGSAWKPQQHTVKTVLTTIKSLMTTKPVQIGGDELSYTTWNASVIRHETIRVAVCGEIEAVRQRRSVLPASLSSTLCDQFLGRALWFGKVLRDNMYLDGSHMVAPISENSQVYDHSGLYQRLLKITQP
ncbi:hypothetical protein MTO96_005902 [Rhipicephalus appendiculatus]